MSNEARKSSTPSARRQVSSPAPLVPESTSAVSEQSFLAFAAPRLRALAAATEANDAEQTEATRLLGEMLAPWAGDRIGKTPRMPSDISDDHFPIEFSVAFLGTDAEVRFLVEPRATDASMASRWAAGQALNERLERHHGVSLARLRLVEDLFVPTDPCARYAMWHSVCFRPKHAPKFKVYLNPQAQGTRRSSMVLAETLRRLEFKQAAERLSTCTRDGDELKFFSLDLDDSPDARVKVYKVLHGATRQDVERELSQARGYSVDALRGFFRAVVGSDGPLCGLPVSTYLALTSREDRPTTGTVHFPIRDYVENDEVASERVRRFLTNSDRVTYERVLEAFVRRSLRDGLGMHSYVSLAMEGQSSRVTVYLSAEGYRVAPARAAPAFASEPAQPSAVARGDWP
jgi:DMATS type aromatic prenyltransferase